MPFFKTVGHIDDNLSQEEIMKEYRRRYTLAAYRRRRAALITELGGRVISAGPQRRLISHVSQAHQSLCASTAWRRCPRIS